MLLLGETHSRGGGPDIGLGGKAGCSSVLEKIKLIIVLSRTYHRPIKRFIIFPISLPSINNNLEIA
jgi:hypothetical protein